MSIPNHSIKNCLHRWYRSNLCVLDRYLFCPLIVIFNKKQLISKITVNKSLCCSHASPASSLSTQLFSLLRAHFPPSQSSSYQMVSCSSSVLILNLHLFWINCSIKAFYNHFVIFPIDKHSNKCLSSALLATSIVYGQVFLPILDIVWYFKQQNAFFLEFWTDLKHLSEDGLFTYGQLA